MDESLRPGNAMYALFDAPVLEQPVLEQPQS